MIRTTIGTMIETKIETPIVRRRSRFQPENGGETTDFTAQQSSNQSGDNQELRQARLVLRRCVLPLPACTALIYQEARGRDPAGHQRTRNTRWAGRSATLRSGEPAAPRATQVKSAASLRSTSLARPALKHSAAEPQRRNISRRGAETLRGEATKGTNATKWFRVSLLHQLHSRPAVSSALTKRLFLRVLRATSNTPCNASLPRDRLGSPGE
jgi:hypothetical protein